MKIEKQLVVDRGAEDIWGFLWDVERVAACIRGTSDVRILEDRHHYSARVTQRVGPFGVSFPLLIDVVEADAPHRLTVSASGRDAKLASGMKATMQLTLRPQGEERTIIDIDTTVALQGRLASLGQGIIGRKADDELEYFSEALARELQIPKPADG